MEVEADGAWVYIKQQRFWRLWEEVYHWEYNS